MFEPKILIGICVSVVMTGCAYSTVAVSTRVLNAATGRPVPEAIITVWPDDKPGVTRRTESDADGKINVPSFTAWDWRPGDPGLDLPVSVRVEAPGYIAQEVEYCCRSSQTPILLRVAH